MDSSTSSYNKKQRNPKSHINKQKVYDAESETKTKLSKPVANVKESDPQPQRANRRPRNEQQSSNNNTSSSTPQQAQVDTKLEDVKVDHSNLKRETEEIVKLTKKFTKREITSNWNRYSAPIGVEDTKCEDEAPADFSHLLQFPVSRGGHFQLKEELEWSAVSGSELSGFFALDLQFLSHSLACIPVYERLRLPKHMFTKEEIDHFDLQAKHADSKKIKLNALGSKEELETSLKNAIELNNSVNGNSEETIKASLVSLDNKDNLENHIDKDADTNIIHKDEVTPCSELLEISKLNTENLLLKAISDKAEENTIVDNLEEPIGQNKHEHNEKKVLIEESKPLRKEGFKLSTPDKENQPVSLNFSKEIVSLPNEKCNQQKEIKKTKEENNSKLSKVDIDINLDDEDDDLDFLLSLRKPTSSNILVKEDNSVLLKDSTLLPSASVTSTSKTSGKSSELDDWLDSVLQE